MSSVYKRRKAMASKVDHAKAYPVLDAMSLIKQSATAKFDEAVDVAVNLGIDAKTSDQTVRGSVVLPAGTGKKVRIAVFAQGDKAKAAKDAGADIVAGRPRPFKHWNMDFACVARRSDARGRKLGQNPRSARADAEPPGWAVTPDVARR